MTDVLKEFHEILFDANEFNRVQFRAEEIEFYFKELGNAYQRLVVLLDSLSIEHETMGNVVSAKRVSDDQINKIYNGYEDLFTSVYQNRVIVDTSNLISIRADEMYVFEFGSKTEHFLQKPEPDTVSWMDNYVSYSSLLKLFKSSDILNEFDDTIKNRLMIVDNGKEKSIANVQYKIFEKRVFSKKVSVQLANIEGRINDAGRPNNLEWLSIFKYNVVNLISAQEVENQIFAEIFLNVEFIIKNTERDYNIYLSGFSFEKISKELKDERQKYFDDLYQAQDKIKAQIIAVPLSVGTSVYAFFQLNISLSTFYFLLIMIAIYVGFIWWYLMLSESDLDKLREDVKADSSKFETNYPKVFELFKKDFTYINKRISAVKTLSWVIKIVTLVDLLVLAAYIIFFYKQMPSEQLPFHPKYASVFRLVFAVS